MKVRTETKAVRFGGVMMGAAAMMSATQAFAEGGEGGDGNFSTISDSIAESMGSLPGLMSALAYLMGVVLGILGVLKIKDHVENPTQTPLKDGAVRLGVGGALFALPMLFEAMINTIGADGTATKVAKLNSAKFELNDAPAGD